ncbi:MAG: CoA-binding protein [Pseudomonadales bacterium]|nr:CoA-binding protein [Pseudomonadales bacterium]MBO6595846.1 CoA-binding protein [Pseudomonadales bacterium]MBO6822330.1 CoA-binding protein [Pseudomonadales bacterium]
MSADGLSNQEIRRILENCKTIAMVGLSGNWFRPSYFAAKYLMDRGYKVIPVNPNYDEILGQPCVPDLASIDEPIDVVDLFQREELITQFIQPAEDVGASVIWMQLGLANQEAASAAKDKGMSVVMDRCMKIEYARLFGGLTWSGVNTGIISSKRPRRVV